MRGITVLLLLAAVAWGDDDAALLARVRAAFRNYDTADAAMKSFRIDITMPGFAGAQRLRVAYQAPNRFAMVVMSQDDQCPIAVAREEHSLLYDVADGRMLFDAKRGSPFLFLGVKEAPKVNFTWGFNAITEEHPKSPRFAVNLADLVKIASGEAHVRREGKLIAYVARTKAGGEFRAWFHDLPKPTLARAEFWAAGLKTPFLVMDGLEINQPILAAAFPVVRGHDWKKLLPIGTCWPKADGAFNEETSRYFLRNYLATHLGYSALNDPQYRGYAWPDADDRVWADRKTRHSKLTPRVRARWRRLYRDATPRVDSTRMHAPMAIHPSPNDPVAPQVERAKEIVPRIRDLRSGQDGLDNVAIGGKEIIQGTSVFGFRAILREDDLHIQVRSSDDRLPLAIAHKDRVLLFDAAEGALLESSGYRPEIRIDSDLDLEIDLHANHPERPRVDLPFASILKQFPHDRRAYPDPNQQDHTILRAKDANGAFLFFFIGPDRVDEVWLQRDQREFPQQLLTVFNLTESDKTPAISTDAFAGILPVRKLDPDAASWRVTADGEEKLVPPVYFLAVQRMALYDSPARAYFPAFSKQHWGAFEQREEELTPKVVAAWHKAFGKPR